MLRKTLVSIAAITLFVTLTVAASAGTFSRTGAWPYGPSSAVAVDAERDLIFLSAGGAMLILDGTDHTSPILIYDQLRTGGLVRDVFYEPATQRLYLACGEAGLEIWDVQDPSSPVRLSRTPIVYYTVPTPVQTVIIRDHFAVMNCQWGFLEIADVSDPTNPIQTSGNGQMGNPAADAYVSIEDGKIHATGPFYYLRFYLTPDGQLHNDGAVDFTYFGDGTGAGIVAATDQVACVSSGNTIFFFDLLSPGFPLLSQRNVGGVNDMIVDGDILYVIKSNLQIWSIQNPSNPTLIESLPLPHGSRRMTISNGYAYVADYRGVEIIDLGGGSSPALVGSYESYGSVVDARVAGDYAYLAAEHDGLDVIDVSDFDDPQRVAQIAAPGRASDIAIDGDRAYLSAGTGGLRIVDIADPTAPSEIGAYTAFEVGEAAVSGTRVYADEHVPNQPHILHVLDVTDPNAVSDLGSYPLSSLYIGDIVVDGDYVYVAVDEENGGVSVLDVSDPSQIAEVASYPATHPSGLSLEGDLLYVACYLTSGGLYVVDVSDPHQPTQVGEYRDGFYGPAFVVVDGGFAYTSDFLHMTLISVTDPSNPQLLGSTETPGTPVAMPLREQNIFVADAEAGLQIYENLIYENPGVDWEPQESPTPYTLHGVDFTDTENGWAVGESGAAVSTTDGGETWVSRPGVVTGDAWDVSFVDGNTGWIAGGNGLIRKTTDGGETWTTQGTPTAETLYAVEFIDAMSGWAVGREGVILHTTDGGAQWQSQQSGTSTWLFDLSFVDMMRGWVVGDDGLTLRTTDGGQNWQPLTIPGGGILRSVDFIDEDIGWLTGAHASVYRTNDGGLTWNFQRDDQTLYSTLIDIQFLNMTTGWAVGGRSGADGQSLHTTDGGGNWEEMRGGHVDNLNAVDFVDAQHGWAVGALGVILRYVPQVDLSDVPGGTTLPGTAPLALFQGASPNPFNPVTNVSFTLARATKVRLRVFDVAGRSVATLAEGEMSAGPHAMRFAPLHLASGIYLLKLEAGGEVHTRKITFVR